jgi:Fur family transcriptional regulator, ferric uptake regulator
MNFLQVNCSLGFEKRCLLNKVSTMKKDCCDTHLTENQAHLLLSEKGISRTKLKTQILLMLSKNKQPMSATEIYQKIGAKSCDISSVWRTLKQFHEKGLSREINLGEDFFRYELKDLSDDHDHHHHHVRCRDCGGIKNLEQCDLTAFEKMVSKLGFKKMEHYLEFTGICSKCS